MTPMTFILLFGIFILSTIYYAMKECRLKKD